MKPTDQIDTGMRPPSDSLPISGANLASRLGVAPLGKGRAIPCAARSQVGSE